MLSIISTIFMLMLSWFSGILPEKTLATAWQPSEHAEAISHCDLSAASGIAVDLSNHQELCGQNQDKVMPIASISKLMSALIFLDHNPGWETTYRLQSEDRQEGGRIYFFSGDEVTIKDLFYSALIASDNTATAALVRASGLSQVEFIQAMNIKASQLGLDHTHFLEPTGLNASNHSTAREVAVFAQVALNNPDIRAAVLNSSYTFITKQGSRRTIYSTGQPLASQLQGFEFLGGKTGYLIDSGYCFVGLFAQGQQQVVTVILGASDKEQRFSQTAKLLQAYKDY